MGVQATGSWPRPPLDFRGPQSVTRRTAVPGVLAASRGIACFEAASFSLLKTSRSSPST